MEQNIIDYFHTKVLEVFGQLAKDFSLRIVQEDETSVKAIGSEFYIMIYLYPSHIPSVNITIMPTADKWLKWRKTSLFGNTGIWLAHIATYRNPKIDYPTLGFHTSEELSRIIDKLVLILRDSANDILRGDLNILPDVVKYIDKKVS